MHLPGVGVVVGFLVVAVIVAITAMENNMNLIYAFTMYFKIFSPYSLFAKND